MLRPGFIVLFRVLQVLWLAAHEVVVLVFWLCMRLSPTGLPAQEAKQFYSHSMVAGGLELMSYTTRFIPLTLLMISFDTLARKG